MFQSKSVSITHRKNAREGLISSTLGLTVLRFQWVCSVLIVTQTVSEVRPSGRNTVAISIAAKAVQSSTKDETMEEIERRSRRRSRRRRRRTELPDS